MGSIVWTVLCPGAAAGGGERWFTLEAARGSFDPEDYINDVAQIKFDKAVPIKASVSPLA